jgi:hypothetical protein
MISKRAGEAVRTKGKKAKGKKEIAALARNRTPTAHQRYE